MSKNLGNNKQDIVQKYTIDKLTMAQIATIYNCSYTSIRSWLRKWGIPVRPYNELFKCDESYFEKIDTPTKAYFLGFIWADGCVRDGKNRQKQLMFGLHHEDGYLLEKLKQELQYEGKVYYQDKSHVTVSFKEREKTCQQADVAKIHISSNKLCNDLINLGCTPRKTFTCTFPEEGSIPNHLIKYFVLGYFDGDGCIYVGNNQCSAIFCGTFSFLNRLRLWLANELNFNPGQAIRETMGCYQLTYRSKPQLISLYNLLYAGIDIFLTRKKNKFLQLLG